MLRIHEAAFAATGTIRAGVVARCRAMAAVGMVAIVLTAELAAIAAPPLVATISEGLKSADEARQLVALEQVAELGPGATQVLPGVRALLSSPSLTVQTEALMVIGSLGPEAESAVPELLPLLEHSSVLVRGLALAAVRQIGPGARSAAPAVAKLLAAEDLLVRTEAAWAYAVLGTSDSERVAKVLPILKEGLESKSAAVRDEALHGLVVLGKDAVPVLKSALKTGTADCKVAAAHAVGKLGPDGATALEDLLALAGAANVTDVQASAIAAAVAEIGVANETAAQILTKLAAHPTSAVIRAAAARAWAAVPTAHQAAVPMLKQALADVDPSVRQAAAESLGTFGPQAASAVAVLDHALGDARGGVTVRAADALGRIGAAAVPVLVKRLDDPQYADLAVSTLAQMGPAAKPAIPALVAKLQKPGTLNQRELCLCLAFLEAPASVAGPALMKVVNNPQNPARPAAIYALGRIRDPGAFKAITNLVEDDDPLVKMAASWALLQYDLKNPEAIQIAIPRLQQALGRPDPRVRRQAVETLRQLGTDAQPAAAALLERLQQDEDPVIRGMSAVTLLEIGALGSEHLPVVAPLVQDADPRLRRAGLYVLGRLGAAARPVLATLRSTALQGPRTERGLAAWAALQVSREPTQLDELVPVIVEALPKESLLAQRVLMGFLGEIGQGRPAVLAALRPYQQDADPAVRVAASAAIAKLTATP